MFKESNPLKHKKFRKEELELIREEYSKDRIDLNALAKKMRRDKSGICLAAKRMGLTSQKRPGRQKFRDEQIKKLFDRFKKTKHLTVKQFCRKHGIHQDTFANRCKELFPDEWDLMIDGREFKQTKYRIGRQFEYKVKADLEKSGYFVLRSPRSKGLIDLIALRKGRILCIQCKRSDPLWAPEAKKLFDFAVSIRAEAVCAYKASFRKTVFRKYLKSGWTENIVL